jgi:hypothetical protein
MASYETAYTEPWQNSIKIKIKENNGDDFEIPKKDAVTLISVEKNTTNAQIVIIENPLVDIAVVSESNTVFLDAEELNTSSPLGCLNISIFKISATII